MHLRIQSSTGMALNCRKWWSCCSDVLLFWETWIPFNHHYSQVDSGPEQCRLAGTCAKQHGCASTWGCIEPDKCSYPVIEQLRTLTRVQRRT